jgi:hypothetical protein
LQEAAAITSTELTGSGPSGETSEKSLSYAFSTQISVPGAPKTPLQLLKQPKLWSEFQKSKINPGK